MTIVTTIDILSVVAIAQLYTARQRRLTKAEYRKHFGKRKTSDDKSI